MGHKILVHKASGNYDLVEGITAPNLPGPPPHYHTGYHELFIVLEGKMEFIIDGKSVMAEAGESVDLPPHALHTFRNAADMPCRWVNIHSPKGFLSFFEAFGINTNEENAFEKSVEDQLINGILEKAAAYDMNIVR